MRVDLNEAIRLLAGGGVVAFPTETVYGLGARAADVAAVAEVFRLKARPTFDPLIVHVADADCAWSLAAEVPDAARRLAATFWPGPLTLVLPKRSTVPDLVTAGLDGVGLRVPVHPLARALVEAVGPLAAPSANPFGGVSPTAAEHVEASLGDAVAVLDGGPCEVGVESTVLAVDGDVVTWLRPGGVPLEAIEAVVGPVSEAVDSGVPRAPGRLLRHYAPRTPLWLDVPVPVEGRFGWMGLGTPPPGPWVTCESLGENDVRAAQRLFACLRSLDGRSLDGIIAHRLPPSGLGRAVNDRLERASWR